MAQLTLQIDSETASRVQRAAEREGLSQNEWVSRLIRIRLESWPDAVTQLAGAWPDLDTDTLRQDERKDVPREAL